MPDNPLNPNLLPTSPAYRLNRAPLRSQEPARQTVPSASDNGQKTL